MFVTDILDGHYFYGGKKMGEQNFLKHCKEAVKSYNNNKLDNESIGIGDIYVVWSCKTLQNNKALLSTNISDGMYYELTYNGDKGELYLDAYKKQENICIDIN